MRGKDFVEDLGFKEGVLLGVVIAVATMFTVQLFAPSGEDKSSWAAAAATFFAAIVALAFGLEAILRDQRRRRFNGFLVSAGLKKKLSLAAARIENSLLIFDFGPEDFPDAHSCANKLLRHLRALDLCFTHEDLIGIAAINSTVAMELAEAKALVSVLSEIIEHALPQLDGLNLALSAESVQVRNLLSLKAHFALLSANWNRSLETLQKQLPSSTAGAHADR